MAKTFHWLMALLIVGLLILGFLVANLEDHPLQAPLINIHKLFGLSVLCLVALRLIWKLLNPRPKLPLDMPAWEIISSNLVHGGLYLVMIVMPLSGWIMSTAAGHFPHLFGYEFPMPGIPQDKSLGDLFFKVHFFTAWIIIGLVTIHTLAAFKHHFFDKDNVLQRMLPGD